MGSSIARYHGKELEVAGRSEPIATAARAHIPQSVGRRCCLRYRYFHAERRRCMVDGVARCRSDLRRADTDRRIVTVLSAGSFPADSAGGIVDRRRLVLFTESSMKGVALLLERLTISGLIWAQARILVAR